MSKTMVVAPIMAALVKSEDVLGPDRQWNPVKTEQAKFLYEFFAKRAELARFSEKELRNWVSWVAAELNAILAREGFDIRLEDFLQNEFGVVSILDVLAEWVAAGQVSGFDFEGREYPAVRMRSTASVEGRIKPLFHACISPAHSHPIAVVYTQSGDKVCMTVADGALGRFELTDRIEAIRGFMKPGEPCDLLKFPMVDIDQKVDIGWLKGMWTTNQSGNISMISQALQRTKFKMNQFGARVKSAVAITVKTSCVRVEKELVIGEPFFLWIEREGVSFSVMYAYVDEADWKDPGDLSNM